MDAPNAHLEGEVKTSNSTGQLRCEVSSTSALPRFDFGLGRACNCSLAFECRLSCVANHRYGLTVIAMLEVQK